MEINLSIVAYGPVGRGKSILLKFLTKALEEKGLKVTLGSGEHEIVIRGEVDLGNF